MRVKMRVIHSRVGSLVVRHVVSVKVSLDVYMMSHPYAIAF